MLFRTRDSALALGAAKPVASPPTGGDHDEDPRHPTWDRAHRRGAPRRSRGPLRRALLAAAVIEGLALLPGPAAAVVLGSDPGEKVALVIDGRSPNPAAHRIAFSASDAAIAPGGVGSSADPVANGASAVVFSAADCQCFPLGRAPATLPGWTTTLRDGAPHLYR